MFVNILNFNITFQEERTPNEEPPTMTGTQSNAPQLDASHQEIAEELMATVNQTTMTEAVEDTPVFRQRLQKMLGVGSIISTEET